MTVDELLGVSISTSALKLLVEIAEECGDKEIPLPVILIKHENPPPEIMEWARQQYIHD